MDDQEIERTNELTYEIVERLRAKLRRTQNALRDARAELRSQKEIWDNVVHALEYLIQIARANAEA